jgi:hypothetical protein
MTRKHFIKLAGELGLRLAEIADNNTGAARQDQIAGFWHGVAAVRAASRSFSNTFDGGRFNNEIIVQALYELNIEHRHNPDATEWQPSNLLGAGNTERG